jgi:site-specific recombinase XerD
MPGAGTEDPATVLDGRRQPEDRTKAIAASSLERLFRRTDVAVREKCLWRLLYETAAWADEVLSSDVADLDVEYKRMRVRRKGATPTGCISSPGRLASGHG